MLSYPAGLQVSTRALTLLTQALEDHRRTLKSSWRALSSHDQALLVLARFRKHDTYAELADGFGIGLATVSRYVHEALTVLTALAPTLAQAVQIAAQKAYVILDGTVVDSDRVAMRHGRDGPYFSGKTHAHGVNVQVIADPTGRMIWASPAVPGATNDIKAAREHDLLHTLTSAGVTVFADKGYQGAGPGITVPFKPRRKDADTGRYLPLSANQKAVNRALAKLRAPGERANAQLKAWRILQHLRSSPSDATQVVKSILVLILND